MDRAVRAAARARLPDAPALAVGFDEAVWVSPDGEVERLDPGEAARRVERGAMPLVCHARAVARRLGARPFAAHDVLELFAFVRPARFCVPTPLGLSDALLLPAPASLEAEAACLYAAARALLGELTASPGADAEAVAWAMGDSQWQWARAVLSALASELRPRGEPLAGLKVWRRLREWEDAPPEPPPDSWPVEPVEARARLIQFLGSEAEPRAEQLAFVSAVAGAFAPRDRSGVPQIVLAEAGTGVGKTIGYIAPAEVWARKNRAPVWISTYTRNLQRQIDRELDRVYPNFAEKARRVVIRKGRENTLCLLNLEDALASGGADAGVNRVALGLVARWAAASRDGDMVGGDFPGWLADLLGPNLILGLTDTRGECIYSACRHYRKCFIERSIRRARSAELVVANHALVLRQAARGGDEGRIPLRYVFDEGHHLFDAADAVFSLHLCGLEAAELRRWLRGAEGGRRSRRRGLSERLGDVAEADGDAAAALAEALVAAACLPGPGWRARLAGGVPAGGGEAFLALVRQQVHARSRDGDSAYSLETAVRPPVPGLIEAADRFESGLGRLEAPLRRLAAAAQRMLDDKAASLDSAARQRLDSTRRTLERRAIMPVEGWRAMLRSLPDATPAAYVDWFAIERVGGREVDAGFHRHWLDPTRAFAALVLAPAHGAAITSATLRDGSGDDDADWLAAERRTGTSHLPTPPVRSLVRSPFDYAAQTRVFIVTDVARDDPAQIAAAYRELFKAAGGGGLGLFTSINRLRSVHRRIGADLAAAGLRLYAQHVDAIDTGTLIDIFRAEENACLLGT
ncbi:MAG: ATP-dependent DNA helicase, partial [Rhodospirillales bacterium]|nr:ATP-dependent DNA helicase [Rhodospirillales bacterium]